MKDAYSPTKHWIIDVTGWRQRSSQQWILLQSEKCYILWLPPQGPSLLRIHHQGNILRLSLMILKLIFLQHPSPCLQKYACHVFVSDSSTRCVAQAYGWDGRFVEKHFVKNMSFSGEHSDVFTRNSLKQLFQQKIFTWSKLIIFSSFCYIFRGIWFLFIIIN